MDINELRVAFDRLGYDVLNYHLEESFTLRKHGNMEAFETVYSLNALEEKYFELRGLK